MQRGKEEKGWELRARFFRWARDPRFRRREGFLEELLRGVVLNNNGAHQNIGNF